MGLRDGGVVLEEQRPERVGRPRGIRRHHQAHQRRHQRPGRPAEVLRAREEGAGENFIAADFSTPRAVPEAAKARAVPHPDEPLQRGFEAIHEDIAEHGKPH